MTIDPSIFGLQGFSFPVIPAVVCDYPSESDVRYGVIYGDGSFTGTYGQVSEPATPSPADILRRVLIAIGIAGDPPIITWPCYTSNEPASPDNVITTYDVTGRDNGRLQIDGNRVQMYGVQIRVRSVTHTVGYAKTKEIATALDIQVYDTVVQIASINWLVHSVSRSSDVIAVGKDVSNSRRSIFTLNVLIHAKQLV